MHPGLLALRGLTGWASKRRGDNRKLKPWRGTDGGKKKFSIDLGFATSQFLHKKYRSRVCDHLSVPTQGCTLSHFQDALKVPTSRMR